MFVVSKGAFEGYFSIHKEGQPRYDAPVCFMRLQDGSWTVRRRADMPRDKQYTHGLTAVDAYQIAMRYALS